jgi:hypothetical protein
MDEICLCLAKFDTQNKFYTLKSKEIQMHLTFQLNVHAKEINFWSKNEEFGMIFAE